MSFETKLESASYGIGVNIGQSLKAQGLEDINPNILAKAIGDVLSKNPLAISEQDAQKVVQEYVEENNKLRKEKNIVEGKAFLEENSKKAGVVSMPSGLQYEIITEGKGDTPKASDKVKTHYHGTLLNGLVFDSSVSRGEPITFPVTGVIQGWQQALKMMPVGSKWKLYVPYQLAYGERGAGAAIPPCSTLIFEVELLNIVDED